MNFKEDSVAVVVHRFNSQDICYTCLKVLSTQWAKIRKKGAIYWSRMAHCLPERLKSTFSEIFSNWAAPKGPLEQFDCPFLVLIQEFSIYCTFSPIFSTLWCTTYIIHKVAKTFVFSAVLKPLKLVQQTKNFCKVCSNDGVVDQSVNWRKVKLIPFCH